MLKPHGFQTSVPHLVAVEAVVCRSGTRAVSRNSLKIPLGLRGQVLLNVNARMISDLRGSPMIRFCFVIEMADASNGRGMALRFRPVDSVLLRSEST